MVDAFLPMSVPTCTFRKLKPKLGFVHEASACNLRRLLHIEHAQNMRWYRDEHVKKVNPLTVKTL